MYAPPAHLSRMAFSTLAQLACGPVARFAFSLPTEVRRTSRRTRTSRASASLQSDAAVNPQLIPCHGRCSACRQCRTRFGQCRSSPGGLQPPRLGRNAIAQLSARSCTCRTPHHQCWCKRYWPFNVRPSKFPSSQAAACLPSTSHAAHALPGRSSVFQHLNQVRRLTAWPCTEQFKSIHQPRSLESISQSACN